MKNNKLKKIVKIIIKIKNNQIIFKLQKIVI